MTASSVDSFQRGFFKIRSALDSADQVRDQVRPALVVALNLGPLGFDVLVLLNKIVVTRAATAAEEDDQADDDDQYDVLSAHVSLFMLSS